MQPVFLSIENLNFSYIYDSQIFQSFLVSSIIHLPSKFFFLLTMNFSTDCIHLFFNLQITHVLMFRWIFNKTKEERKKKHTLNQMLKNWLRCDRRHWKSRVIYHLFNSTWINKNEILSKKMNKSQIEIPVLLTNNRTYKSYPVKYNHWLIAKPQPKEFIFLVYIYLKIKLLNQRDIRINSVQPFNWNSLIYMMLFNCIHFTRKTEIYLAYFIRHKFKYCSQK